MPIIRRLPTDPPPVIDASTELLGMHRIVPIGYAEQSLEAHWNQLAKRAQADPKDAAARHDLATILQTLARPSKAMGLLKEALAISRDFCIRHGTGEGLRILAFVTPGDFMTNTPIDFLLNGSNALLWLHYIDEETTEINALPEHDVAFMAIGESPETQGLLKRVPDILAGYDGPIMNNRPEAIRSMTRDATFALLKGEPRLAVPENREIARNALIDPVTGVLRLGEALSGFSFPLIIRPHGTHAGGGMEKIDDASALGVYLEKEEATRFYVAPFIDYRGADGLYNKQRVVLIDGQPFASHMAMSDHWMVHYLSAGMKRDAAKRAVEAAWMEHFDEDYALRHADAFAALHRLVGLDYFGFDCAEVPDGRLLVFELDVAMIVHDMDDEETFPYKKPAMRKLFNAFVAAAERRRR